MATFPNPKTGEIWDSATYTGDDQEVIAAPAAGKTILIKYFAWSASAQATVIFEQGSSVVAGQYAQEDGGMIAPADPRGVQKRSGIYLTPAIALTVSASAGNVYVNILYEIIDI